jgi:calcineurin-like phosphoesterase family protein
MTIWFTSDTHFGHAAVLQYSKRPWPTVEEMDLHLMANWWKIVGERDEVYHLGDFSFHKPHLTLAILDRLPGRIHLIRGNHDRLTPEIEKRFVWVKDYYELKWMKQKVVLCHYPLETWNKAHYGSWHLHGHCHNSLRQTRDICRMDVGVDAVGYRPIQFEEVADRMAKRGYDAIDHHTRRSARMERE